MDAAEMKLAQRRKEQAALAAERARARSRGVRTFISFVLPLPPRGALSSIRRSSFIMLPLLGLLRVRRSSGAPDSLSF
jgi:hypothetical protein